MRAGRAGAIAIQACRLGLPLAFALLIMRAGVPVLRHDWFWPRSGSQIWTFYLLWTSGWSPLGIGAPVPNPAGYIVAPVFCIISLLVTPAGALFIFLYAAALVCTYNASYLSSVLRAPAAAGCAAQAIAVFNPWVYNEIVAGHILMVLSYGAMLGIAARVLARDARAIRGLPLQVVLVSCQLQFFVPSALAVCALSILKRSWVPLLAVVFCGLPIALGLALDSGTLMRLPYILTWQSSQSVRLSDGVFLLGYFAQYAHAIAIYQLAGLYVVVILAALGAFFAPTRSSVGALILAAIVLLFASGTSGPVNAAYVALVQSFKPSALYRELYDVLAFLIIAYLALSLRAGARIPKLSAAAPIAAALIASFWITNPPERWWVGSSQVPVLALHEVPNARYALLPPFQPLSYHGRGSGADPDLTITQSNFVPLNQYMPAYPEQAAFARYMRSGEIRPLEALSVAQIYERAGFTGSAVSIAGSPQNSARVRSNNLIALPNPAPELSLAPAPNVAGVVPQFGSGNVFFADAPCQLWSGCAVRVRTVPTPSSSVDARHDWVDARLVFSQYPDLAEPFGGAFTQSTKMLPIPQARYLLANISGALVTQKGAVLTRSTHGLKWIATNGSRIVRCIGRCLLVLDGDAPPAGVQDTPPPVRARAIAFRSWMPWLVTARLPAHVLPAAALRYNVRYDRGWIAVSGWRTLVHFRIDATINGWLVDKRLDGKSVVLIQTVALAQFVAELLAYAFCAVLLGLAVRRLLAAPRLPRPAQLRMHRD